jgi:hypothetical protein
MRAPTVRSGNFDGNHPFVPHPAVLAVLVANLEPDVGASILVPVPELAHDLGILITKNLATLDVLAAVLRHVLDV